MKNKFVILIVDSNRTSLEILSQQLEKEGYQVMRASSLEELDSVINNNSGIALSIVDISGFDERIWERYKELHDAKVPFMVISSQRSSSIQRDSMKYGASCLLIKPLGAKELVEYINTLLGK